MNKFLGLDIGQKRIGVAISEDELVSSYGIIENTDLNKAVRAIGKICREHHISKVIIGIPKFRDTFEADKIRQFALTLAQNLNLEVDFTDETLTSREAERKLKEQKLDRRSRRFKEEVDKLAAKYILEQYIQEKS